MKQQVIKVKTKFPLDQVAESLLRQMINARRDLERAPNSKTNQRIKFHLEILDALGVDWREKQLNKDRG